MPLRPLPYRIVRQNLLRAGFEEIGQRGSHVKFIQRVEGSSRTVIVSYGRGDVKAGTLRGILK